MIWGYHIMGPTDDPTTCPVVWDNNGAWSTEYVVHHLETNCSSYMWTIIERAEGIGFLGKRDADHNGVLWVCRVQET